MIKTFKYKELSVKVKTNKTKNGIAYYGGEDIIGILEATYKLTKYHGGTSTSSEVYVTNAWKDLKSNNVAPFEVSMFGVAYRGVKMTEIIEEE